MKIEQVREVSAPIDEVWEFFDDMPRVATCLPGATLTNVVDDRTYEGTLGMKVGPISVNYAGTIVLDERDTETRTVRMTGRGKDGKGAGTAHAKIVTQLSSTSPDTTTMRVSSDVRLTGRIASLGRGVQDVAGKIFEEFAQRVSDELAARPAATEEPGETAAESADLGESAAPAPGEPRPRGNDIKVVPLLWSIVREKVTAWFARLRDTWAARRAGGR